MRRVAPWLAPALFVAARLALPPPGPNTHTFMYPLVEAAGAYNTLEPFHPLYPLLVGVLRRLWELLGGQGPALPAIYAASLAAGAAHLALLYRAARLAFRRADLALGAALIGAASANLWSWSLQSSAYNFATACLLAAICVLLGTRRLGPREALAAGLWTGLAAGFDLAAVLLLLPVAVEFARRARPGAPPASSFALLALGAALPPLLGLGALLMRLVALGWPFPPTLSGLLGSLPSDIVPLWVSWDPLRQLRVLWECDAPSDWPRLVPLAILAAAWPLRGRPLWRLGAGFWLVIQLFYLACDPHNRFVYAGGLLLPALLAGALARLRARALPAACAAAALLVARNIIDPPKYASAGIPGLAEAEFLAERLGPRDLIVGVSEPDWTISYGLAGRVPVLALAWPEAAGAPRIDRYWGPALPASRPGFGHERRPYGPELDAAIARTLCAGGRVVFAADALFRSSGLERARLDAEAERVYGELSERFLAAPLWVSPQGQHYQGIAARPGSCPSP